MSANVQIEAALSLGTRWNYRLDDLVGGMTKERKYAMKNGLSLVLFLALVLGGGLAIGFLTAPGDWYTQLAQLQPAKLGFRTRMDSALHSHRYRRLARLVA